MKELQAMVGYTVISNDEYRNLILENKELKETLENSSAEKPVNSTLEKIKKHFLEELYKDNKYQISNLEFAEDGRMNTTSYYYSVLQNSFLKIGIDDLNYIYNRICELYSRYEEEQKQIEEPTEIPSEEPKEEQEKKDN